MNTDGGRNSDDGSASRRGSAVQNALTTKRKIRPTCICGTPTSMLEPAANAGSVPGAPTARPAGSDKEPPGSSTTRPVTATTAIGWSGGPMSTLSNAQQNPARPTPSHGRDLGPPERGSVWPTTGPTGPGRVPPRPDSRAPGPQPVDRPRFDRALYSPKRGPDRHWPRRPDSEIDQIPAGSESAGDGEPPCSASTSSANTSSRHQPSDPKWGKDRRRIPASPAPLQSCPGRRGGLQ